MKLTTDINEETLYDVIYFDSGLYAPLDGFMTSLDYHNVVDEMMLSDHSVWTLPITIDVDHDTFLKAADADKLFLNYDGREIGYIEVVDCYRVDAGKDVLKVFKTADLKHPGVKKELSRHEYRVGGKVVLTDKTTAGGQLNPKLTKEVFLKKGWKTIVGFQTRNPIHKAHEHLQRVGLDLCDGLFINPIIGWKKMGDFSEEAVMASYNRMVEKYYPKERVHLEGLKTYMRYAGPREAIFHAIIRRNLGCTHFIIGRDHAGVGDYYGKYEAHDLAKEILKNNNLGIQLLLMKEPYYCKKCGQIVSEKHCGHEETEIVRISGTQIREMLSNNERPDERFMRGDISDVIIELNEMKFIGE